MASVHRAARGAKKTTKKITPSRRQASKRTAGALPSSSEDNRPTRAQRDALKLAKALARRACLLAYSRRGTPEAAALDFIASALVRANIALLRAHREGRELRCVHVGGRRSPELVHGPAPAQVIPIAPYLAARRGGARG